MPIQTNVLNEHIDIKIWENYWKIKTILGLLKENWTRISNSRKSYNKLPREIY